MNKLKSRQQKIVNAFRHPIWLISAIAVLILPVYILLTSLKSNAAPKKKLPEAATVRKVNGTVLIKKGDDLGSQSVDTWGRTPQKMQAELRRWGDELTVQGDSKSRATLEGIPNGPQVSPKAQPTQTIYEFPCTGKVGGLIIGFQQGQNRGCVPPGFEVRLSSSNGQVHLPNNSTIQAAKNLLKAQATRSQLLYCTVAATGQGWWFRWGTVGNYYNPCEEATQQCMRSITKGECTVVSLGEWSARELDLVVSVECADNRVFTDRGNGLEVAKELVIKVTNEALNNKATSCALNVYQPDKLIVAPASEMATLVQAQDFNGSLAIDALAGDVIIRSARNPSGILLKVRNRYIYPENSIQPTDFAEIIRSPAVREFLDPANWAPNTTAQIKVYQTALSPTNPNNSTKIRPKELLSILWNIWGLVRPTLRPERTEDTLPPSSSPPSPTSTLK